MAVAAAEAGSSSRRFPGGQFWRLSFRHLGCQRPVPSCGSCVGVRVALITIKVKVFFNEFGH